MFLKNIIGFSQPIIPSYISNSFLKNLWLSVETQRYWVSRFSEGINLLA